MDEKQHYEDQVDESDLDLFYGFFDSVIKETEHLGDDDDISTGKVGEWAPEPFEEYLVGVPDEESAQYYGVKPSERNLAPTTIHYQQIPERDTGAGALIGMAVFAVIMWSAYSLGSETPLSQTDATAQLEQIEQSLSKVEARVHSVDQLQQQVSQMQSKLDALTALVAPRPQPEKLRQDNPSTGQPVEKSETKSPSENRLQDRAPQRRLQAVIEAPQALLEESKPHTQPMVQQKPPLPENRPTVETGKARVGSDTLWVVNLLSSRSAIKAAEELKRIRALGIAAESVVIEVRGKPWTRLRVPGYISKQEAAAAATTLADKSGLHDIWIGKR